MWLNVLTPSIRLHGAVKTEHQFIVADVPSGAVVFIIVVMNI
jgi:hypothetical protein